MLLSVFSYSSYSIIPQDGDTALTKAVRKCGAEVVVELVKAGAYVNLPNHVCHCIMMQCHHHFICACDCSQSCLSSHRMEYLL